MSSGGGETWGAQGSVAVLLQALCNSLISANPLFPPTQIWDISHPQTQLWPNPVRRDLGTEPGFESPRQLLPSAKV